MPPRKRAGVTLTVVPKPLVVDAPDLRDAIVNVMAELAPTDVDRPLFALALLYADELAQAREIRDDSDRLMREMIEQGEEALLSQLRRLRRRIELAETVAKVGPLLQAALSDLLATPAAKAKAQKTVSPTAAGQMSRLRAEAGGA